MNDDTTPKPTVTEVGYNPSQGLAGADTGYFLGNHESPEARGDNQEFDDKRAAAVRRGEIGCVTIGKDTGGTKWGHYF